MHFQPFYSVLSSIPGPNVPSTMFAEWVPGSSPLSTYTSVSIALAVYLGTVYFGSRAMKSREPFKLKGLFTIHNALLSVGSGLLLGCMLEELVPVIAREGFYNAICSPSAWTPRLERMYIINYYFKYWELADTMFLVVKKKPLKFLHVYHHSATAALCFTQLNGRTSVSWVPIVLNLTVHVLMYYYYGMSSAGYKIWWKKYLTSMQITQFVIDLAVLYFASYNLVMSRHAPWAPHCGTCAGTEPAALIGCGLLTSYLFLFIAFYKNAYSKKPSALPSVNEKTPMIEKAPIKAPLVSSDSDSDSGSERSVPLS